MGDFAKGFDLRRKGRVTLTGFTHFIGEENESLEKTVLGIHGCALEHPSFVTV